MIKEIIIKSKKNPFLVFGWTLFTLCIGYLINQELTFPDRAAYLEEANLEISVSQMEYDRINNLLDIYEETGQKLLLSIDRNNSLINENYPQITEEVVFQIRESFIEARQELSVPLVLFRNSHFVNEEFTDLIRTLEADATYSDNFISKRIDFLDLIVTDFDKAIQLRSSLELGIDEKRKMVEISSRNPLIEYTMEKARQEFNTKLRTAQRKESLYKTQSTAAILASSYIGLFIGGWIGYFISLSRKKKYGKQSNWYP